MWISRTDYERLVAEAALALQVPKLELRAEQAELALASEREQRMRDVRHVLSMFLRREKAFPLPPTATEKAEAKAEKEQKVSEPPKLNEDQQARLNAAIEWGQRNGFTEEEARKSFMAQLNTQVMDE